MIECLKGIKLKCPFIPYMVQNSVPQEKSLLLKKMPERHQNLTTLNSLNGSKKSVQIRAIRVPKKCL
jgi:hypothetical protein